MLSLVLLSRSIVSTGVPEVLSANGAGISDLAGAQEADLTRDLPTLGDHLMQRSSLSFLSILSFAALCACGGSHSHSNTPADDKAAEKVELPDAWGKGMSEQQEVAFMQQRIIPAMAEIFHEADEGEKFTCESCHGPEYKDPQEYLPSLTFKDGAITSFAEEPEASKFMAEKVVPAMAKAMGLPAYDVATGEGFGCGGCHAIEMK